MYKTSNPCKSVRLKLGFDVVRWLEGCSRDIKLVKYSVCSGSYKYIGLQMFISWKQLVYGEL